ncbi:MAG: ubiquinone/menaquinone biosynthesis methyltransferase [Anaerolineaceae bacterium]|nr:ubiquinone/menaquinone biosynthesis methyltransferase [Anaerolineaceae bacterium]
MQKMFGTIAPKYDLLNRLMTAGQDTHWRKIVVDKSAPKPGEWVLDVGSGTGDLAFAVIKKEHLTKMVAADFTIEMIHTGRLREGQEDIHWVVADAENLPFERDTFAGVVSGFLLRNVPHLQKALEEQVRVLASGGKWVALDTTPPKAGFLRPFIWFHMHIIIPLLGKLIAGNVDAYTYLPETSEKFLSAERLAEAIEKAGIFPVKFIRKMFGTMAIHWGKKRIPST